MLRHYELTPERKKRLDDAWRRLEEAVEKDPDNLDLHFKLKREVDLLLESLRFVWKDSSVKEV